MADETVVLNAGSSSLKFSVFVARGGGLEPDLRANIEEIDTAPCFVAKDGAGLFGTMLNEEEFLSPYGLRSLSRYHRDHPFVLVEPNSGASSFSTMSPPGRRRGSSVTTPTGGGRSGSR